MSNSSFDKCSFLAQFCCFFGLHCWGPWGKIYLDMFQKKRCVRCGRYKERAL